ncbi:iron complex outermembrane recepter protein [Filimonas lacunae]|uniref:Iron complex outermembrane recepter protein n=1 Tax=Filimonas lacunae TaxID=477680 RepID=A0A173MCM3_9BACT|nr:TonB-dependent receptor [Filimonas lacunae]BAV05322.1 ferrichrome-iron receptor [Filimonas lacunae]SIT21988.1 iron complex outermembrane recepter protein [Filimonas lacunae]
MKLFTSKRQRFYTRALQSFILLALFFVPMLLNAAPPTRGVITGKVVTNDGQPAQFATIILDDKKTIHVNKDGVYRIENLEAGTYNIAVSFAGQEPQTKTVEVKTGETATADFALTISAQNLNEVVIIGSKYSVAARKKSSTASRLPLNYLENPQSYSVIDKELIGEQMAITLEESFRNVPGAVPAKTGGGMPAFASRGFYNTENLRNGMATNLKTGIDLASVERVEAVKGPSSTLFGGPMVAFGGLVNYITKKPYQKFGGEVSYTAGSFELNRLAADINTPLNDDKTVLFRINLAAQNKNDFQDQGYGSTLVVSPSITYLVNDKLTFHFDADIQTFKGTNNTAWTTTSGVKATSLDQLKLDFKRSLIDNSFVSNQYSKSYIVQAEYKMSEHWTSQTNFSSSSGGYNDLNYFYQFWTSDSTVARNVDVFAPDKTNRTEIQQNFIGDFHIGRFRNRVVIGLDYLSQYRSYKYRRELMDVVNINQPIPSIRKEQLDDRLSQNSALASNATSRYKYYAAYISDVFNISEQLMVMASLRADRINSQGTYNWLTQVITPNTNYNQAALSPKLGIVYQPVKDKVALFANYMSGFNTQTPALNSDGTVVSAKPKYGNQWEGGVKLDLLQNKLSATISYYNIGVKNAMRLFTQDSKSFYAYDGEAKSKGVEAEVIGNPFAGFNFVAGYGFNENSITKAASNVGKSNIGTPKHVGNFWASYALLNGGLKGLGFGAGAMYSAEAYVDAANTVTMPAYTVIDATVFYNVQQFHLGFKANNIANKKYWVSDGFYSHPMATTNFLATIAYKF